MKYYKNIQTTIKNRNFIMLLIFSLILLFLLTFKTFGLAVLDANLIVFDNENKFNPTVQAGESNGIDFYAKISIEIKEKENPSIVYSIDKNYDINAGSNIKKSITNTKEIDNKILEGYKLDLKLSSNNINVYSKKSEVDGRSHLNVFAYEKNTLHIVQYDISNSEIPANDISRYKYKFVKFEPFNNNDIQTFFKDENNYKELFGDKIKSKPTVCTGLDDLIANTWYIMGVYQDTQSNNYELKLLYSSPLGSNNKTTTSFVSSNFQKKLETINKRNSKNYIFDYNVDMEVLQNIGFLGDLNQFASYHDINGQRKDFFNLEKTFEIGETVSDKIIATLSADGNIAIQNSDPNDIKKYILGNLNEKLQKQMTNEEIQAVKNISIANNMFVSTGNRLFAEYTNLEKIQGLEKLDTSKMITASYMFSNCRSLINVNGVENWDVSNVRYFDNMFYFNNKLSDISTLKNWNTTNASDMSYIFFYTSVNDLTPLSNWNVSNVKTFNSAFAITNIKNLDALNNWNTQNTIIFSSMFSNCPELIQINGINSWNVQNGSIFDYMFSGSSKITYLRGLQYWNISYNSSKVGIFDGIPDSIPKPPWY